MDTVMNYQLKLKDDPYNAKTYYELGVALVDLGRDKEALEKLSKARELFLLQGDSYSAMEVSAAMGAVPFQKGFREMQEAIDNLSNKLDGMETKIESNSNQLKIILEREESKTKSLKK